ncbi:FKBP-type peptidyl-prolyl cis-trans isomerase N-terminal domain-containing protein [Klebsiella michiganensis]|uniref:FKBP-type peptidyl-prolyl cis-trans isomerase N-terminal domain-containing protein n=1 Tax=Klebsiella michiganensis TaxID=1134687 RepID=UPI0019119A8A
MMYHKGKLNIYNFRGFAILLSLFTLIVMFPARAERGDFLDNISKLEINNPPASDAASGDSASANQHNNSRDKKAPQKQDVVRKKVNQTKTESTLNALRKQNAELTAAAKAAEKKLDETTRQLSAQIAALKAQRGQQESGDPAAVSALMKKNAELTAAADTAQKKLDDTTRDLSAQISALKAQNAQRESGQKTALDALTKKNAELTAAAAAAQKKLDDTTRDLSAQISALKAQNTQRESGQKAALDALTKKNAELIAAAAAAQKNLDDMTRTMSVQIAALQTQKEQGESLQKTTIDTLTGKNLELRAAAAATQKKLDETTRVLSAKIAALKNENTQGESQQKTALDALSKKNAELIAAAETAQKKYDASVAALNDKNKELQSTLDSLAIKQSDVNLADKSNKNAYALGVFYLTQALSDVNKMADNNVKLAPSALVSGFNDAYNKKLKIKENEIESIVNMLNEKLSSKYVDIEKRIMAKIKNKKYEILPNGVYFVIDKKGKAPYKQNETLSLNILEKKLDGTPILNTMNSMMVYDKQTDPLMAKVLSSGFKGGTVTLYGQAGSLYSSTPDEINPDTLISITFELLL